MALLAAMQGAIAQSESADDPKIDPLLSESPFLGLTASAPMTRINEYTGKVQITLNPVGVGGMIVAPVLPQPPARFELGHHDEAALDNGAMAGWQGAHQGYLRVDWEWVRGGFGHPSTRIRYVQPGGGVLEFQSNPMLGDVEDPTGISRAHMTYTVEGNTNLLLARRVLPGAPPDVSAPSGNAVPPYGWRRSDYVMQRPDGSVETFRLAGYVAADHSDRTAAPYTAILVPVERKSAAGRITTIRYDGPGEFGIGHESAIVHLPRVAYIRDPWGRRLHHHYEIQGGQPRLRHLTLQYGGDPASPTAYAACGQDVSPGSASDLVSALPTDLQSFAAGSACQRLGAFEYMEWPGTGRTVLRRAVAPDYTKTIIDYDFSGDRFLGVVSGVQLPTGGRVAIEYSRIELPTLLLAPLPEPADPQRCSSQINSYCLVEEDRPYLRASRVSHSGANYAFSYRAEDVAIDQVTPELANRIVPGWPWQGRDRVANHYLISRVELEGMAGETNASPERYARETYYHHPKPDAIEQRSLPRFLGTGSVGLPGYRSEQYTPAGGDETRREEFWSYTEPNFGPEPGRGVVGDVDRVQGYVSRADGIETLTQYEYWFEQPAGVPWPTGHDLRCLPAWVPVQQRDTAQFPCRGLIKRVLHQTASSPVLEQRFDYHHEFPPVSPAALRIAAEQPFHFGYQKEAKESWGGDVAKWVKRVYAPITGVETRLSQARLLTNEQPTWLHRDRTYHPRGGTPRAGLLASQYVGRPDYATRFDDYLFDVPVTTKAPETQPTISKVDLAGRVTHTMVDKAVERSEFDLAGRVVHAFQATTASPNQPAASSARTQTCWKLSVGPSNPSCASALSSLHQASNFISRQSLSAAPGTTAGWVPEDLVFDAWGREVATWAYLQPGLQGQVGSVQHSLIGLETARIDHVDRRLVRTRHDVFGRPTSREILLTDASGNTVGAPEISTTYDYRRGGDGSRVTRATRSTWVASTDPKRPRELRSITTHRESDFFGRPTKQGIEAHGVGEEQGNYTRFHYAFRSELGQWQTEIQPDGGSYRRQRYDLLGNLVAESHPELDGVSYTYDPERGLLRDVVHAVSNSHQGPSVWRTEYDNAGRPKRQLALDSLTDSTPTELSHVLYDDWGREEWRESSVDGVRQTTVHRDDLGRPRRVEVEVPDFPAGPAILTTELDLNGSPQLRWNRVTDAAYYLAEVQQDGRRVWQQRLEAPAAGSGQQVQVNIDVDSISSSAAATLARVRAINTEFVPTHWSSRSLEVIGQTECALRLTPLGLPGASQVDFGRVTAGSVAERQIVLESNGCAPGEQVQLSLSAPYSFNRDSMQGQTTRQASAQPTRLPVFYRSAIASHQIEQTHSSNLHAALSDDAGESTSLRLLGVSQHPLSACNVSAADLNLGDLSSGANPRELQGNLVLQPRCGEGQVTARLQLSQDQPFEFVQGTQGSKSRDVQLGNADLSVPVRFRPSSNAAHSYGDQVRLLTTANGPLVRAFSVRARVVQQPQGHARICLRSSIGEPCSERGQTENNRFPIDLGSVAPNAETTGEVLISPVLADNLPLHDIEVEVTSSTSDQTLGQFEVVENADNRHWPACAPTLPGQSCRVQFRLAAAHNASSGQVLGRALIRNPGRNEIRYLELKATVEAPAALALVNGVDIQRLPQGQTRIAIARIRNEGGRTVAFCRTGVVPPRIRFALGSANCASGRHHVVRPNETHEIEVLLDALSDGVPDVGTTISHAFKLQWWDAEASNEQFELTLPVQGTVTPAEPRFALFNITHQNPEERFSRSRFDRVKRDGFCRSEAPLNAFRTDAADRAVFRITRIFGRGWFSDFDSDQSAAGNMRFGYNFWETSHTSLHQTTYTLAFSEPQFHSIVETWNTEQDSVYGEICVTAEFEDGDTHTVCQLAAASFEGAGPGSVDCTRRQ